MGRRILIHVEGQTEETFVNTALAPHLHRFGYESVGARLVGNARQRVRRGGIRDWTTVKREIVRHLNGDRKCFSTTMVDYYALPSTGVGAWPGRHEASRLPFARKAPRIQESLSREISAELGGDFSGRRFIPYVMMHEFEGLLFSNCESFARGIARPDLAGAFQTIRDGFATPEEINDSPQTAPSKRILELVPGYQKPTLGTVAILEIGLEVIRDSCPQFGAWLTALEDLPDLDAAQE